METLQIRKRLEEMIASGDEEEAFRQLLELAESQKRELREQILLASNKHKNLLRDMNIGVISREQAGIIMVQITQSMLAIIEEIEAPAAKREVEKTAGQEREAPHREEKKEPGRMRRVFLLVILTAVTLLSAYFLGANWFNGANGDKEVEKPITAADWEGDWPQERQSRDGGFIQGVLTFQLHEASGRLTGFTQDNYPNGSNDQLELYDILLSDDGKRLSGRYRSKKIPNNPVMNGTFQFELDDDKLSIRGRYNTQEENNDEYFAWNGARKKLD